MNLQLICDHRRLIRGYTIGWPGSVYDSDVIGSSKYCTKPKKYFSNGQFLMADAGYALLRFICTPFRQPAASLEENELFNHLFSSARVTIEHVNGILKGRFGSLKGLRIEIKEVEDFKRLNEWVLVCLILHNILTIYNDDFDCEEEQEADIVHDIVPEENNDPIHGENLRDRVQEYLLRWYVNKQQEMDDTNFEL